MPGPCILLVIVARSGGQHNGLEMGGAPVGSRDSSSPKESQSLQMSADLLSVYEREDEDGGEGHGNSNGYA